MIFNIFQLRSIKTRVTLFSLLIFLVGIWALVLYANQILHRDLEQLLGEQQLSTATILAEDLNQEVDFRLRSLEKIAKGIDTATLNNPAMLLSLLENHTISSSLFNGGLFVTLKDGTAICSLPRSAKRNGINFMDRDYIANALQKGQATVGKAIVGKALHTPVVGMAVPIRTAEGNIIGALAGVIDLSRPNFLDGITEYRYGRTGGFLVVSKHDRMIVTASDKTRIMEKLPKPGISPTIDRYIQGDEGHSIFVNPKGIEVLVSVRSVPVANWYFAAILPTQEAFAPAHRMLQSMLVAAGTLTILLGGVIWWMLRRQLSPLFDTIEALSVLSASDQPMSSLPVPRQDEVGQLIEAFNHLIVTLALRQSTLSEREESYKSILHTAINGIWQTDRLGFLIEVNEAYCRMSGYTEQELLTMNISDLDAVETHEDVRNNMQQLKTLGEARFEKQHRRKDGTIFDVEISAQYRFVGDGQCVAFVQDITERKKAEIALRRSRDEWSRTFDAMRDLIFIIDDNYNILRINQTALDTLGITREKALMTPCYVHMHGNGSPPQSCPQAHTLRNYGEHQIETLLEPLKRHYQVTTTPIFDDDGNYQATVHVAHDITENIIYERELEVTRDAAESANRAKSEFLANMSHELRTPMNGIMGMTQLLKYTRLTDEQKQCLDAIETSSDNLLSLLNDILDLSRIESGKIKLEQKNFSLRRCLGDVINIQISLIQKKGLTVQTDITPEVPDNLIGDQLRLKQIMLNLLGNAIKFTSKGGIKISVTVTERADNIAVLTFGVTDSGIGISPDAIRKIFAPFVQADGSATRQFGGAGLGLAICSRLTELMEGRIWVESCEGSGSTFFVQIPLIDTGTVTEGSAPCVVEKIGPLWDGPPLKILLVDDQQINLTFASRILNKAGHQVIEACNGREALEKLERHVVDIILMDIQMPVMSGIEATLAIRSREKENGEHIKIIAVSARALHEERTHILMQGFDGYVVKPFAISELFKEMKRCLS